MRDCLRDDAAGVWACSRLAGTRRTANGRTPLRPGSPRRSDNPSPSRPPISSIPGIRFGKHVTKGVDPDVRARAGPGRRYRQIAWLLAKPGVAAPVASATSPAQLASLTAAVTLQLTPAEIAAL